MSFNSLNFLVFFPIVIFSYFLIPHRFRSILLLLASYYFYMCWKVEYVFLIFASTLVDYYAGIQMGKEDRKAKRKKFLLLSLIFNLGLLFVFKYFNFFSESTRIFLNQFNIFYDTPTLQILLPVGISFYTFQTLSYSIDVYRGVRKPEKNFMIFALYVSFFPQLVAGPIERSTRLLPQFYEKHQFSYQRVREGIILMFWGFFKKIVIADRLGILVSQVYNNPYEYTGVPLIIATYFFAFQIYCDFSGYTDIAIGAAKVMGFDLMKNFNRPYAAKSIREFWHRWHISLSSWFRDYLYIPLGGSRVVSEWRLYFNIFVVFLLSGLWHGANWTFLVWGALHGFYMVFAHLSMKNRERFCRWLKLSQIPFIHNFIKSIVVFHLILFGWVFFRANSIADAFYIIKHMFDIKLQFSGYNMGLGIKWTFIAIILIVFLELVQYFQVRFNIFQKLSMKPIYVRWFVYEFFFLIFFFFGAFQKGNFIYFQF